MDRRNRHTRALLVTGLTVGVLAGLTGCVAEVQPASASRAARHAAGSDAVTSAVATDLATDLAANLAADLAKNLDARVSFWDPEVEAWVCPPAGWRVEPVKSSASHVHKTWVSATGDTAYGVIRFRLPLPMSSEMALWGFMREMKRTQGESILLAKTPDETLAADGGEGGMRFVAEGGIYKVRTNLTVRGFRGWCVYAGTLRARPENPPELVEAVTSREQTAPGRNATTRPAGGGRGE